LEKNIAMNKFKKREDIVLKKLSNHELKSIYNLYVNYKDNSMTEVYFNDMNGFKECFGLSREEEFKEFVRSDKYESNDMYISIDNKGNPITFDDVFGYVKKSKILLALDSFVDDELELVLTVLNGSW